MSNIINISQILIKRGNTIAANSYVGPLGELLVDTGQKTLRLQDGSTPGGMSTLVNSVQLANLAAIVANLSITAGAYGNANVAAYLPGYTGSIAANLINFVHGGQINTNNTGTGGATGITITANINNDINGLYIQEGVDSYAQLYTRGPINFYTNTEGAASNWTFGADGNTTLPATTGRILFPYNENSNAIIDNSQDIGQFFIIQNNFADGYQGINLDTDDAMVTISSKNTGGYPLRTWNFDWQGQMRFPDSTYQSTAYQGPAGQTDFATNANLTVANAKIAVLQTQVYTNSNVATYLPTYTGNITAGNLTVSGNINYIGNVNYITGQTGQFQGNAAGFGAMYTGILSGYTYQPQTVLQASTNFNGYAQINHQNINNGSNASTDFVATADVGNSNYGFIDMGINSSGFVGGTGNELNYPLDGYILVQGQQGRSNGNLLLSTDNATDIVFSTNGQGSANEQARFKNNVGLIIKQSTPSANTTSGALQITGGAGIAGNAYIGGNLYVGGANIVSTITTFQANVGSFYTWANTNFGTSSYANANVAAYLVANPPAGTYSNTNTSAYLSGNITTGNINVGSIFQLHTADNSLNTTNGSSINVNTRLNVNGSAAGYGMVVANPILASGGLTVSGNSNATSFYGTNYYWANGVSLLSGIGGTYSNANVVANLQNYVTSISTTANITTTANMIAPNYLFANGVNILSTITPSSSYSNTNVAAYLTTAAITTTGNITAGNLITSGTYTVANITTTGAYGNITGANVISANTISATNFVYSANGVSILSGIGGTYSNTNVAAYLTTQTFYSNANVVANLQNYVTAISTTANITTTANIISPNYLFANGVNILSTIAPSGYSNANVVANLANFVTNINSTANIATTANMIAPNYLFANGVNILSTITGGSGTYSNTNVSAYLTTATISTTGNITGGNLVTSGNVYGSNFVGNITTGANITASYFITSGSYGNISGVNTIFANNYVYANGVSILTGIGGTYSNTNVAAYLTTQTFYSNSNVAAYLVANPQGSTYSNANVVANLQNYVTNISSTANIATTANIISPNYLFANGVNILSTITPTSSYSNTNVAAYLTANPISSIANGGSSVAFASSGGNGVVQIGGVSTAIFSQSQLNVTGNIIASANIQAANIIATQYGNSVGTTASYSGNVTAAYFTGNGVGLTGITYNQIGNIYGSSSNVTLQAGSYSWTFDNTGNLVIPTTSNIVYANGTVFTSGTGGGGTNYTNANVVAMLAANTAVFIGNTGVIGNVASGNIQANATAIFLGANTVISNYGSPTFGYATHIGNNIYFDANGVQRYRNTQTGAADLIVAPGTLNFYATGTAVTANTATGYTGATSLYMALSTSGMSLYNNAGLVSSGPVTIQSASGLVTNQATIAVFNTATTTTLGSSGTLLGTAGLLQVGPASGQYTVGNVIVGQANIATGNNSLTIRSQGTYNSCIVTASNGGWNTGPFTNMATSGGSGTGMTVTVNSTQGGYVNTGVYNALVVNNPGTGYKNGDVITCLGGGGCTFVIYNYNPNISNSTTTAIATYQFGIDGNLTLSSNSNIIIGSTLVTTTRAGTGSYILSTLQSFAVNSGGASITGDSYIGGNVGISANVISSGNIVATGNIYGNVLTFSTLQTTGGSYGNITGANVVSANTFVASGNVTAGNIVANQYGNSIGTTATYTGNVTAAYFVGNVVSSGPTTLVGNVSTGNLTVSGNLISTGYGFFPGAYSEASTSAGVFVGNTGTGTPSPRIGLYNGVTSQNWQIDNYGGTFRWFTPGVTQMQLDPGGNLTVVNGNATVAGNVTISGNAGVIQSNRTAFRVYGQGGSVGLNANLVASNWTVDYTQGFAGTALNGTTGIFTAPIAGLYSTTLTARTTSNTNSSGIQAVIQQRKAGITSVACMIEWAPNTTFNHATGSTVVKLAQGDQLWVQCLANGGGSGFSFDGNDHWDVTYLG